MLTCIGAIKLYNLKLFPSQEFKRYENNIFSLKPKCTEYVGLFLLSSWSLYLTFKALVNISLWKYVIPVITVSSSGVIESIHIVLFDIFLFVLTGLRTSTLGICKISFIILLFQFVANSNSFSASFIVLNTA